MNFKILPYEFEGSYYFISPLTGNLIESKKKVSTPNLNQNIKCAEKLNNEPYTLNPLTHSIDTKIYKKKIEKVSQYNRVLMKLGNSKFFLSCMYSRFRKPIFENTTLAFDHISKIDIHKEMKGKLCLQRSLLAAKTSKSFKKNGVLFIGAQLPTGVMHAWIIEDKKQPDRQDREWIMYKPLLAITF